MSVFKPTSQKCLEQLVQDTIYVKFILLKRMEECILPYPQSWGPSPGSNSRTFPRTPTLLACAPSPPPPRP